MVARRLDKLNDLAKQLRALNPDVEILTYAFDLANEKNIAALKDQMQGRFIEILVNNAGYGLNKRFIDTSLEKQIGMIDLNNRALVALTHLFLPDMVAHNKGQIIQVASVVAFTAAPFFAVYAASKAFVLSFARALMLELEKTKVRVIVICPGPTETEFGEVAQYSGTGPPKFLTQTAEQVAQEILDASRRDRSGVHITGRMNRAMLTLARGLPSRLVSRLMQKSLEPDQT